MTPELADELRLLKIAAADALCAGDVVLYLDRHQDTLAGLLGVSVDAFRRRVDGVNRSQMRRNIGALIHELKSPERETRRAELLAERAARIGAVMPRLEWADGRLAFDEISDVADLVTGDAETLAITGGPPDTIILDAGRIRAVLDALSPRLPNPWAWIDAAGFYVRWRAGKGGVSIRPMAGAWLHPSVRANAKSCPEVCVMLDGEPHSTRMVDLKSGTWRDTPVGED